jgi:hypothetical protein
VRNKFKPKIRCLAWPDLTLSVSETVSASSFASVFVSGPCFVSDSSEGSVSLASIVKSTSA